METQYLTIILKDIIEEYYILEDSPLQKITHIAIAEDAPALVVSLSNGSEFRINITKTK